ncbi:MAG: hypothetical protein C4K60_03180 [Ideonella sp. MAG2]|nr:MAG: hypothetical protein C4K60_03180 [Ideonella sp. MAG2]
MKHLIVLVIALFASYGLWNWLSPIERREDARVIARHAVRLGILLLISVALLIAAYYSPAIALL